MWNLECFVKGILSVLIRLLWLSKVTTTSLVLCVEPSTATTVFDITYDGHCSSILARSVGRDVNLLVYIMLQCRILNLFYTDDISNCAWHHYNDVIMGAIAPQITSITFVFSIVCSDADQRKHQSSASLAFVRGIHRGPVNSPHKWPVTRKMFPFDDVIMLSEELWWKPKKIYCSASYYLALGPRG